MHTQLSLVLAVALGLASPVTGRAQEPDEEPEQEPDEAVEAPMVEEPVRPAPWLARVFIGADGIYQSSTFSFRETWRETVYREEASWTADYSVDAGPAFDISAGVRVSGPVGARVAFSRFTDSGPAEVSGSVPHPFFFNNARPLAGESQALDHDETAIHLGVLWLAPVSPQLQLGMFGGPSFYRVERDLVAELRYSESYPYDTVTFEGTRTRTVQEDAIGFHVGADIAYYFTPSFGVGALARFARASVDLLSPASGESLSIDAGGFQVGGGLRLRFGGSRRPRSPASDAPVVDTPPEEPPPGVRIVSPNARALEAAAVYIVPDVSREPLIVLEPGARLRVLEVTRDWLRVEFSDPRWGPRVGWIRREYVDWD